jgi:hypothetical protein
MMEIQRTIEYDADRVKGFGREIISVPGCGASGGTAALLATRSMSRREVKRVIPVRR